MQLDTETPVHGRGLQDIRGGQSVQCDTWRWELTQSRSFRLAMYSMCRAKCIHRPKLTKGDVKGSSIWPDENFAKDMEVCLDDFPPKLHAWCQT